MASPFDERERRQLSRAMSKSKKSHKADEQRRLRAAASAGRTRRWCLVISRAELKEAAAHEAAFVASGEATARTDRG